MIKPPLYLRTLGATNITSSEGVAATLSTREAALIAFLCSKRNSRATRSEIAELFWPNVSSGKGRHSLSQLIYSLRARLPGNPLVTSGEDVAVTGCQADFIELARDMEVGRTAEVVRRYRGRFLPKDDLCSSDLRDWRDQIEVETAEAVAQALQEQSCVCGNTELADMIDIASEILAVHPHLMPAQIASLEAHSRLGHSHEVQRAHARFKEAGSTNLPPISSFLGRRASPQQVSTVRFVGRESELEALQRCWTEAEAGAGSVAVILGEPGIGKTRLADHFLRRVAIRGGTTWIARCCAATQRLPYSVVSEFIRENVLEAPGKAGARIIEDLSSPAVLSQSEVANDEGRYQLTETLTSLVLQKCESQPLVIFVDDAQWADEYTALLLSYWAYRLRSHAVLLLLTVRTEEAEPPPEWIFSDLGRVSELHLSRISIEAASDIVSAFESSKGIALDKKLRDAVLWQSGGRPFLLLEALSSIIGDDLVSKPTAESVLTESAESVLRRRFRNLSSDATSVLSALAVWGREIGSTGLSRIAAVHGEPFVRALDLLHSRGIAYWLDGLVAFPHDLMREAAYRNLTPPMRALYHRRAAEEVHESAGRVGLVAQHYARAGDSYLAASHASQAAVEAMAAHSYTDYEYYCRLSIDHGTVQQKRQAADKLSRFLVRVGRTAEIEALGYLLQGGTAEQALLMDISRFERDLARGDCQVIDLLARAKAIIGMAASLKDLTAAPVVATLIDVAFDAGADDFGLQVIDTLLPEPSHTLASEAQIAVESIVAVWRGVTEDIGAGLRQAEVALSRLPQPSSPTTEALCLASYGTLQLLSGRIALARSKFEGALKLSVAAGDHRRQLSILNNNGIALLEAGDIAGARQSFERVLTAPNIHSRIRGYGNLAILHYEVDDLTNAALAAEAVLSMNAAYRSPALDILGHSILGLISLRDDKISRANSHACQVRRLIDLDGRRSGDATYSTLLLTRLLLHDGRKEDALLMLDQMIEQTQSRDILCAMRLKCEKASIAGATEPDKGFAIAREVISESSARGASLIERYASDIIRRFVHY